jgi:glutathione S-transferase
MADASPAQITLFHCPQSRSITALWMLEEIGIPYRVQIVDVRAGAGQSTDYLALNPMGKVPALQHGSTIVTEAAAICLYLADRFALEQLSAPLDSELRGRMLRWLFFAPITDTALVEKLMGRTPPERASAGWGDQASVLRTLRAP